MTEQNHDRDGEARVRALYEHRPYPDLGAQPKDQRFWLKPLQVELDGRRIRYLDAGCGTGHGVVGMARFFPDWVFAGIDLSQASLDVAAELAKRHRVNVDFRRGSYMDSLPFEEPFDLIMCGGTIHHAEEPAGAVRNLLRHLAGDGYIFIHLYGKELDRNKFKVKEILSLMEPDLGAYDHRHEFYLDLKKKQRKPVLDLVLDVSARKVLSSLRRRLLYARRNLRGQSWNPPWTDFYPTPNAPWADHFCHPLERAYDVLDVKALATASGLDVVHMINLGREDLSLLPERWKGHYDRLDQWSKWRMMELLDPVPRSVSLIGRTLKQRIAVAAAGDGRPAE